MSKVRVAINGLGRIGKSVLREYFQRNIDTFEVVAINNPGDAAQYIHLLKYDSVHGIFPGTIEYSDGILTINDQKIRFFNIHDPNEIPWSDEKVDIVIDSTGRFKCKETLSPHKKGTVKKVIMCAPGKNLDATIVMGINQETYKNDEHHFLSNASCTTNCLAPIAKVLNDNWVIENGYMTTVHSYTLDQSLLDRTHDDYRRARAAAQSIIPTSTGAAKAIGLVIPELNGKLDGHAVRVPTPNVSLIDFVANVKEVPVLEDIISAMKEASESHLKNILGFSTEPLVSIDFNGRRESSIFDAECTKVLGNMVKVTSWYDNEIGFSNRVIDLVSFVGEQL